MPEPDLAPRPVVDSQTTLVQLMEISHANVAGIVHGGEVMKLVDTAAGIAAIKHAGGMCVTVSMDEMSFLHPVHVGDLVTVKASVNDIGHTSLEVGVRVEVEDVMSRKRMHTSSAYLVFVALDEDGVPRPVPPLIADDAVQRRRQREAKIRRQTRLAHRAAIESHRRGEGGGRGGRDPATSPEPASAAETRSRDGSEPDEGGQPPHLRI